MQVDYAPESRYIMVYYVYEREYLNEGYLERFESENVAKEFVARDPERWAIAYKREYEPVWQ